MTREEAIKILKSKLDGSVDTSWEWTESVRMAIEALSAEADRQTGWIPVSERLPKECDGNVLVSKEDGQVTTGVHSEFGNVWYIGDMCGVGGCKVIAWMPLPETYREDGEACTE